MTKYYMGYSETHNFVGRILVINYGDGKMTLVAGDGTIYIDDIDKVIETEVIGDLHGEVLKNHDVVVDVASGDMFEVVIESGVNNLYKLDNSYQRERGRRPASFEEVSQLTEQIKYVDNVFKLRKTAPKYDFNIKVVKTTHDGVYYYACNDKDNEKIDLIKVVFVGHHILEEEDYARLTLTYKEFANMMELDNYIKFVNPQELASYVMNATSERNNHYTDEEDNEEEYVEYEDEEYEYEEEEEDCKDEGMDDSELLSIDPFEDTGFKAVIKKRTHCESCGERIIDCHCDIF